jgi:calcineurin-like phosphoesterase
VLCPLGQVADAILVDMHAEATSEKQAIGYHLDGRVSVVVGTHTHVPTADGRILPAGTAYLSDAGMCGDYESVLGLERTEPIRRFIEKTPGSRSEVATGEGTLCGFAVETDDGTGLALRAGVVRLGGVLGEARPDFLE